MKKKETKISPPPHYLCFCPSLLFIKPNVLNEKELEQTLNFIRQNKEAIPEELSEEKIQEYFSNQRLLVGFIYETRVPVAIALYGEATNKYPFDYIYVNHPSSRAINSTLFYSYLDVFGQTLTSEEIINLKENLNIDTNNIFIDTKQKGIMHN